MSKRFISVERDIPMFFSPSVQEDYLPESHLARFVVEIVEQLELKSIISQYRNGGTEAYHPKMMLALLFYGYASGTFSSNKLVCIGYNLNRMFRLEGGFGP